MLFAQITDLHVTAAGHLAVGGIDANTMASAAVTALNALTPQPDFVVITGDLTNDGKPEEYQALRDILAPLRLPAYVIPGNHDNRHNLRAAFFDHGYLPVGCEFLHYTVDDFPVRLIALDTVEPGQSGGCLCPARLGWLAKRLGEAPDRPTVILMHHPPIDTGIGPMDRFGCANSAIAAHLVAAHGGVERILCGHVHRTVIVRWGGSVVLICPATAHQVALDLTADASAAWTLEPPAMALHLWLPESGLVSHQRPIADHPATPFRL